MQLTTQTAADYVATIEASWGETPAILTATMGGYTSFTNEVGNAESYDATMATVTTAAGNTWTVWMDDGEIYGEC